jgi:hypothetical protein
MPLQMCSTNKYKRETATKKVWIGEQKKNLTYNCNELGRLSLIKRKKNYNIIPKTTILCNLWYRTFNNTLKKGFKSIFRF